MLCLLRKMRSVSRKTFVIVIVTIASFTCLLVSIKSPWKRFDHRIAGFLPTTRDVVTKWAPPQHYRAHSPSTGTDRADVKLSRESPSRTNSHDTTESSTQEPSLRSRSATNTSKPKPRLDLNSRTAGSIPRELNPVTLATSVRTTESVTNNASTTGLIKDKGTSPVQHGSPLVLLVAYLRSGSTFTASLLHQVPNSFYVFEPLHMLRELAKKSMPARYINGTVRKLTNHSWASLDVETMSDWLSCNLSSLDKTSLRDRFHYQRSPALRTFYMCVGRHLKVRPVSDTNALKTCLPPAILKCKSANLNIFKTIRLRMEQVAHLMKAFPDMKVIHLVRDPRAMFYSQYHVQLLKPVAFKQMIQQHCSSLNSDLNVGKRLLQQKSPNYMMIRYEDIANEPFEAVKVLYDFARLKLTNSVLRYVNQSTSMNLKDDCAYCTRRANSSQTAARWRNRVNVTFLNIVDTFCTSVYDQLGYISSTTNLSRLRDRSIPLMDKRNVESILLNS